MARQTAWLAAPVLALGILACGCGDGAEQVAPPTARGATDDSPTSAAPSATAESTPTRTPFPTRTPKRQRTRRPPPSCGHDPTVSLDDAMDRPGMFP